MSACSIPVGVLARMRFAKPRKPPRSGSWRSAPGSGTEPVRHGPKRRSGSRPRRRSTTRSTTRSATRRYVVSLPPPSDNIPDALSKISSSRDVSDGLLAFTGATSGRSPA